MSTLLYVKADPKSAGGSRTFRLSDEFIGEYKKHHPQDRIITLDLYEEGIKFLSGEDVAMHNPKPGEGRDHPVLKYAYQFLEADKYVFAEPLWNLGVPAVLKAYFDYVCISTITFKYTAEGPVGLCTGKKALNITSRGGAYSTGRLAEWEMGDRYIRTILGFLGVRDYAAIAAENLDVIGQDVEAILAAAADKARELAKTF